jgi:hypothetical protein
MSWNVNRDASPDDPAFSSRFRSGAGFDPWSPATRPIYLDQYWRFFLGRGWKETTGAVVTTTATATQYAQNLAVTSTSGYSDGDLVVIAPGTAQQQVAVVYAVPTGTILQVRNKLASAFPSGTTIQPVWTNDTHPWSVINNAYIWWLSRLTQAEVSNGALLFASGDMGTRYTDTNGETNVPVGFETFGTGANITCLGSTWSTSDDPHARSGNGAYIAAATAGGSGVRTLPAIPVVPGQVLQVTMQAKVWAGTPTLSVVDKANTSTVIATTNLGANSATGVLTFSVMGTTSLEFQVPAGVSSIEVRITTSGAGDIVYYDDLRVVEVQNMPNSGRFVLDDALLDRPLVWLGDSWGTGTTPADLGTMLSTRTGRTVTVVNAAVSGDRLDQMNARIATDVIPHGPRACLVQYGANDVVQSRSQANMEADIDTCIATLRAAGIRPIIVGIPPITSVLATSNDRNDQVRARVDRHIR